MGRDKPTGKEKRELIKKVKARARSGLAAFIRRRIFSGRCSSCDTGLPKGSDGWLCRACTRDGKGMTGGRDWMTLREAEVWDAMTPNERARAMGRKHG